MEIILGVFLKGARWAELWPKIVILAIIGDRVPRSGVRAAAAS
jgi:hypothetical protein